MEKIFLFSTLLIFSVPGIYAQQIAETDSSTLAIGTDSDEIHAKNHHPIIVGGATVAFTTGSLITLNNAWYKDHARTPFHTFNDSREWLQVDKIGHVWSAYTFSRFAGDLWKWTGIENKKAVLAGSLSSMVYLTGIEYLDGLSSKWGWSWADMAANVTGVTVYASQEFLWNDQRISLKFSTHNGDYDATLNERVNDLFGNSNMERLLKDYNQHTYWLSANLKSFIPESKLPGWLNLAIGYGADGMLGGFENKWTGKDNVVQERFDIERARQFYISPDIDFTKISTNKKGLKTLFSFLNCIKVPAPAIMINSKGKLKAYAIYF